MKMVLLAVILTTVFQGVMGYSVGSAAVNVQSGLFDQINTALTFAARR